MKGLDMNLIKKDRPIINMSQSLKDVKTITWSQAVLKGNKKVKIKGK